MKKILLGGRWSGVVPTIYHRWCPLWVNTYSYINVSRCDQPIYMSLQLLLYTQKLINWLQLLEKVEAEKLKNTKYSRHIQKDTHNQYYIPKKTPELEYK